MWLQETFAFTSYNFLPFVFLQACISFRIRKIYDASINRSNEKLLGLWKPILVLRSMDTLNHRLHLLWKNSEAARIARPQMAFPLDNLLLKFLLLILGLECQLAARVTLMSAHARCCEQMEFVKILKPMMFSDGVMSPPQDQVKYLEKHISLLKYGWRAIFF